MIEAHGLKAGQGASSEGTAVAGGGGDSAAAIGVADALAVGLPLLVPQIEPGDLLPVGGMLLLPPQRGAGGMAEW